MAQVTRQDYATLQEGLRELYGHHDLSTLSRAALRLTTGLVGNDLAAYNEVDPVRRRVHAIFEPIELQDQMVKLAPIWERWMHQHPTLVHYRHHPADGPKKISDFLTDAQFRRKSIYTEFYRRINCNYQMVVVMPAPAPLTVGLAFNREQRDFNERDRAILSLVQPHLRQAYENAALVTELADELGRAYDVLDRLDHGVVVIDDQGRVDRASPAAVRFSTEHFASAEHAGLARRLPDTLHRWAMAQIAALRRSDESASRPTPMVLDASDGRLIIRVVTDRYPDRFLLIMHRAHMPATAEPLLGLGLTQREAQALYAAVAGKTNAQIGAQLGISDRTVHKHLENIFRKLNVPNRTAAVARALEWLRL